MIICQGQLRHDSATAVPPLLRFVTALSYHVPISLMGGGIATRRIGEWLSVGAWILPARANGACGAPMSVQQDSKFRMDGVAGDEFIQEIDCASWNQSCVLKVTKPRSVQLWPIPNRGNLLSGPSFA